VNGLLSAVRTAEAEGADGERAKLGLAGAQSRERAGRSWAGRPRGHGARRSSGPRRGSAGRETVGRSWSFVLGGGAQWRKTAPRRRVGASAAADRGDEDIAQRKRLAAAQAVAVALRSGSLGWEEAGVRLGFRWAPDRRLLVILGVRVLVCHGLGWV
jgi:hypothetical protein